MLDADQSTELSELFRLLGDANRLRIVTGCLDGPVSAGELGAMAGVSQSLASHHLQLLRAARLLRAEKRGKQVFYAVADSHVRDMLTNMIAHLIEPHEHDGDEESRHERDG